MSRRVAVREPAPYIKVCSVNLSDLSDWGIAHAGEAITACRVCTPARGAAREEEPVAKAAPGTGVITSTGGMKPEPGLGSEARGPDVGRSVVEAWTDHYVQFEPGSAEQARLRSDLRERIGMLKPKSGHLLHATFYGGKHHSADVENLLLYNVDESGASFDSAARAGVRFELGASCPVSPAGLESAFGYRYELVPSTTRFRHWREHRLLASWPWVDLGTFPDEHRLEQVWYALKQAKIDVVSPARSPDIPFAVLVTIRAPRSTPARRSFAWPRASSTASSQHSRHTVTRAASQSSQPAYHGPFRPTRPTSKHSYLTRSKQPSARSPGSCIAAAKESNGRQPTILRSPSSLDEGSGGVASGLI